MGSGQGQHSTFLELCSGRLAYFPKLSHDPEEFRVTESFIEVALKESTCCNLNNIACLSHSLPKLRECEDSPSESDSLVNRNSAPWRAWRLNAQFEVGDLFSK